MEIVYVGTHEKPHAEKLVPPTLKVHPINVERLKRFVEEIEQETDDEGNITAEEFFEKYIPGVSKPSVYLRGARGRENLTQTALAGLTGIPQRHI